MIGILGGIGSGKTSVARSVSSELIRVIDADRIGHRLLERPDIGTELVAEFGERIRNAAGGVDRAALANLVFGTGAAQTAARQRLETILHPRIAVEVNREIQNVDESVRIVLLDAALLLEAGWGTACDALIYIDTPTPIRQRRVAETRGWDTEELIRREAAQTPLDRKRELADVVIDNSKDPDHAAGQLHQWLSERIHNLAGHSSGS